MTFYQRKSIEVVSALSIAGVLFFSLRYTNRNSIPLFKGGSSDLTSANHSGPVGGLAQQDEKRGKHRDRPERFAGKPRGTGSAASVTIPGWASLKVEKTNALLAQNPENSVLLSSALLLSKDPSVLAKGLAAAESQPIVAASLSLQSASPQARLESAELLIRNNPSNTLGFLAAAEAAFQIGDKEKALDFINRSKSIGGLDLFAGELSSGQDRMFEASGYDSVQRGMLARQDVWKEKLIGLLGNLSEHLLEDAEGAEAADRATWLLDSIDQFKSEMGVALSISQAKNMANLEELTLRHLPPNFQMADGMTSEARAEQLSSEGVKMQRKTAEVREALEESTIDTINEYFRRASEDGEKSASVWLLGDW